MEAKDHHAGGRPPKPTHASGGGA